MTYETYELVGTCPHCGADHEAATAMTGDNKPSPGDYSMCIICGAWLKIDANALAQKLFMRPITDDELVELKSQEPEMYERMTLSYMSAYQKYGGMLDARRKKPR